MLYRVVFIALLLPTSLIFGQKGKPFEGVITYNVFGVNDSDSVNMQTVIFCKDSLIKIVNFHEINGTQTLLKHLTYGKSYLQLEIEDTCYAIRTNEHTQNDPPTYSYKKKCKFKKIGGLKSRKITVKYDQNKLPLTCYFSNKINVQYANAMLNLPGIPTLYYSFSDRQLFRHILKEIEPKSLPLTFFMIPEDCKILTWEEFQERF